MKHSLKLLTALLLMLLSSAFAQTIYVGGSVGTPIFNEDYKVGLQAGMNLTPSFEVRVAGEGSMQNFRPELASLDALYNFFLNVDHLTQGKDALVGRPTNNALYIGAGVEGYYGKSARQLNQAYRFGTHGIVGVEAMLGRFGVFGEIRPGFVFPPNWSNIKPSVRARVGVNFHL